jgi:hypothetical protein
VALAVGAVALVSTSVARAQQSTLQTERLIPLASVALGTDGMGGFAHRGNGRFPGFGPHDSAYLAEALGITTEELEAAQEAARLKAIDQALADGLITEAQAEALKQGDFGPRGGFPMLGGFPGEADAIDYDALLAEELGISVEELQAAREKASELALQAMIDDGKLTQEQADLMKARMALKDYIQEDALFEEVTGMTMEEFQAAMQSAYQVAVQKAVEAGVITQEQADQILSDEAGPGRGFFPGFGGGHGGRGGHGGFERFPESVEPQVPDSDA